MELSRAQRVALAKAALNRAKKLNPHRDSSAEPPDAAMTPGQAECLQDLDAFVMGRQRAGKATHKAKARQSANDMLRGRKNLA